MTPDRTMQAMPPIVTVDIVKTTAGQQVRVVCPYNELWAARARQLGGEWDGAGRAWRFDVRDLDRVRVAAMEHYGSDGVTDDVVTLRVEFANNAASKDRASFSVFGRPIARAYGRDSGARPEAGVVFLTGGSRSGGSVKNWCTIIDADTIVLVRDFPRIEAERRVAEQPNAGRGILYAIEPEAVPVDVDALAAERARLVARLAEIDGQLVANAAVSS